MDQGSLDDETDAAFLAQVEDSSLSSTDRSIMILWPSPRGVTIERQWPEEGH